MVSAAEQRDLLGGPVLEDLVRHGEACVLVTLEEPHLHQVDGCGRKRTMSHNGVGTRMRSRPSERWMAMVKKRYDANEGGIFAKEDREKGTEAFRVGYQYRKQYRVVIRVENERHAYSGLVIAWVIHHEVYPLFPVTAKDGDDGNCSIDNLESKE